jgi:hypothetical protein
MTITRNIHPAAAHLRYQQPAPTITMALPYHPVVLQASAPAAATELPAWRPPAALRALTCRTVMGSWAPNTHVGHRSTQARFDCFCNAHLVPRGKRYPVSKVVLCAFTAHRARRVTGGTVCNNIVGLHAYPIAHALPWPTPPCLKYIITGVEHAWPDSSRLALQPPASLPLLRSIYEETDTGVGLAAAVCACAFAAFYRQFRMGELLPESISTYDPRVHPLRAAWVNGPVPSIRLPWTKTTRNAGAVVALTLQPSSWTCLVAAMCYLVAAHQVPHRAHLFMYRVARTFRPLMKRVFLAEVNTFATAHGLVRVTGHCFRIGGTTQLLASGVPPNIVKAAGRWASDSFLRYWREHERVLPQHVNDLIISA